MKKSLKNILAAISAVAMCTVSTTNFSAFAIENNTPIDRIIQSYDEPYFIDENFVGTALIKENEMHLMQQCAYTFIKMKDGKTLPELNLEDVNIHLMIESDYTYGLSSKNEEAEMKAVEALSKCDGVLSIDKVYTVYGDPAYSFIEGAWVKLSDENKDILSEYKISDEHGVGFFKDGTPIPSDEYTYIRINSLSDAYAFIEKMQNNNIEYALSIYAAANYCPVIAEETVTLYKSDDYYSYFNDNIDVKLPEPTLAGDANEDGKVSIADAVLIMQVLSNPDEFQLTPQGAANADIYGDGDGITAMDALTIQEMEINI